MLPVRGTSVKLATVCEWYSTLICPGASEKDIDDNDLEQDNDGDLCPEQSFVCHNNNY